MLNRLFGGNKSPEEWFESARKRNVQLIEQRERFNIQQIESMRTGGHDPSAYDRFRQGERKGFRAMIADLDKATDARPNFVEAWFNKGCLYALLDDRQQAMDCFNHVLSCDGRHANAYYMIGHLVAEQNRQVAAVPYFRKAVEYNPNDAEAWFELHMALQAAGEQDAAIEARERAWALNPALKPGERGATIYISQPRLFL